MMITVARSLAPHRTSLHRTDACPDYGFTKLGERTEREETTQKLQMVCQKISA